MDNSKEESLRPTINFVWKISKLYEKFCAKAGKPYELTQNEIDVLLFLSNNKTLNTAMDVVRYRFISKSLVSKSVYSLTMKEYIRAEKDSDDRRNIHLFITPKAEKIVVQLKKVQKELLTIIKDAITDEELSICLNAMQKMSVSIDKYL